MSTELEAHPELDEQALRDTIDVLERIAENRGLLAHVSDEQRSRLFQAAGRVAHPGRNARRQLNQVKKQERRRELAAKKAADEQLLATTGMRARTPATPLLPQDTPPPRSAMVQTLRVPRNCYICKTDYREVDAFYDSLCPECAALNWRKRHQTADLAGRVALVTGGRVKIGFHTALKMLRAGAFVVVTTRFPHDATKRFLAEQDQSQWADRLQVHGLDMRHVPSVEAFAEHLAATLPRLDFVLNNACQTVRKPPGFYAHLMQDEQAMPTAPAQALLQSHRALLATHHCDPQASTAHGLVTQSVSRLLG
ncbi:MAG: SDR family NAD(P)-dependent oxidoreductase, partial [Planctomycetota bacterium]